MGVAFSKSSVLNSGCNSWLPIIFLSQALSSLRIFPIINKMKLILVLALISTFNSCALKSQHIMRLTLLPDHDSCYYLKSEAGDSIFPYRRMKIIENSLSDSVNVGFSMVGPNDKGEVLN